MKILDYETLDIVGFGGLRENILVMDESVFGAHRREDSWQGFAGQTYMAHAYFKPYGETGMHEHSSVDIVSVITKGPIHHAGSLMDNHFIETGEVLVQSAGPKSFKHNESNASSEIKGLIQLWFKPSSETSKTQISKVYQLNLGRNLIYGNTTFPSETKVEILVLEPDQSFKVEALSRLYLYLGNASVKEEDMQKTHQLTRGTLVEGRDLILHSDQETRWIVITEQV